MGHLEVFWLHTYPGNKACPYGPLTGPAVAVGRVGWITEKRVSGCAAKAATLVYIGCVIHVARPSITVVFIVNNSKDLLAVVGEFQYINDPITIDIVA
jgi:hypothetical protein